MCVESRVNAAQMRHTGYYDGAYACTQEAFACAVRDAGEGRVSALAMGSFPPGCLWECSSECSGQARRLLFVLYCTPKASSWQTPHGLGSGPGGGSGWADLARPSPGFPWGRTYNGERAGSGGSERERARARQMHSYWGHQNRPWRTATLLNHFTTTANKRPQ